MARRATINVTCSSSFSHHCDWLGDVNIPAAPRGQAGRNKASGRFIPLYIAGGTQPDCAPDDLPPDIAVESDLSLLVKGRSLTLYVTDHAVTQSDIWVRDPATRTAIVGDLVTPPAPFSIRRVRRAGAPRSPKSRRCRAPLSFPAMAPVMTPDEIALDRRAFENLADCAADERIRARGRRPLRRGLCRAYPALYRSRRRALPARPALIVVAQPAPTQAIRRRHLFQGDIRGVCRPERFWN